MPQHAAPRKRMKTDKKRQARNNYVKRTLKTLSKQMQSELPAPEKTALLDKIYSQLDKAAKKGVIHKRTASRRKSRVAALVNKLNKSE
ncbi:MAG: 30S ribosomal protein S20 [Candidatus Cloacimonetes bacterium]|jgi:small subunit ribosomal protein S20|nr:30S ribosomal protein S20 [Candidatus Cloacimonadota bacterium]HNZ06958.1 30S ribosomal protein S20 [Candidatus Cloacimonadota bacterium]HOH78775.1 30S ribosomal protein S20 [Candidatus Cloacimonadota bacterium]HPN40868.1 30S ribosomal protein S20 [Candidatus Cloacimonadota bacterium]